MAFNVAVAADMTAIQLRKYVAPDKAEDIFQHIQDKPLLVKLQEKSKPFGSGANYVSEGVMGALLYLKAGFYVGIAGSDTLVFKSSDGALQSQNQIGWGHAGLQITRDELLQQGILLTTGKTKTTTEEKGKLLDLLETRSADFNVSAKIARNTMLWGDGSADAKLIPGLRAIIRDDPTAVQTVCGISTANTWWRNIAATGIGGADAKLVYSKADGTMTERLSSYDRQLRRYGGNPDVWLAGSDFCDGVERESRAKGLLTTTGWYDKKTNVKFKGIMVGDYEIIYDPSLDDIGMSKRCYCFDSDRTKLRPQTGLWAMIEDRPEPVDQFIISKSMTDRGALTCRQMDCNGVFEMQ